jgi:transposase
MTKYREILRLKSLGFSERNIAHSVPCSRNTVPKVLKKAAELGICWPLADDMTDGVLEKLFFQKPGKIQDDRMMPDFEYIRKELLRNGVTKKLLWMEYMELCSQASRKPLMYSQFCYHIQQDEEKRRATMHINRKPGEQIEVDWAGDPAHLIDPDTGALINAYVFVGVMSYSQYSYAEAFINQKQTAWITAHINMFRYFGGVARILVPDNCKTAVNHNDSWYTQELNDVYHEMAEHYGTAIIPARIRHPKDKPNVEGSVGNISTAIIAALRNEQYFSLVELNTAIRKKLEQFNANLFQKKDGSRLSLFNEEEKPLLFPLPKEPYELAEWKEATVQFNYHISLDNMHYSVPYEYLSRKVNVRITGTTIEIFYNHIRIASHRRLYGRKGQYSTLISHMPEDHQKYLEWNGDRFRQWAKTIGNSTFTVIDAILTSGRVEQQSYKSCMGLLKMADKYSVSRLEAACAKALLYSSSPSYKSVKNILVAGIDRQADEKPETESTQNKYALTRGAKYYGGK